MARLSIEQIRAPDLSVASLATARAGESFQKGMSSASDLLGNYQAGIEESGDAQIFQEIAQLSSEEELNAYFASNELAGRPMSAAMRGDIMNRRDNVLAYGQARANTDGTIASTANTRNNTRINTNADNRVQGNYDWADGVRREDVRIGNNAAAALHENLTYGNSGLDNENVSGLIGGGQPGGQGGSTGLLEEFEGLRTTPYNDPATDSDGNQVGPDIYRSGYGSSTYTTEDGQVHDVTKEFGGTEADARRDLDRRNEQEYNPKIRDAIGEAAFSNLSGVQLEVVQSLLHNYGSSAFSGTLSGVRDAIASGDTAAVSAAINALQGQNGGVNDRRRRAEADAFSSAPRQTVQTNPNAQQGPASTALRDSVVNSQFTSSKDQRAFIENSYGDAITGQNAIDAADDVARAEIQAQQLLDAASGNVDPTQAFLDVQGAAPGATAVEELQRRESALNATAEGGVLSAARLQIGTSGISSADQGTTDAILTDITERQNRDVFQFAQNGAASFEDDPSGSLRAVMLNLGITDVPAELDNAIADLAQDKGITLAQAAYSYAKAAGDTDGFNADSIFTPFGDNLGQTDAGKYADEFFVGPNAAAARAAISDDNQIVEQVQSAARTLGKLERRIQKAELGNDPVPASLIRQRDEAKSALSDLYDTHGTRPPAADPVPDDRITFPTLPPTPSFKPSNVGLMPFGNNSGGNGGSEIQAYLDSLNN